MKHMVNSSLAVAQTSFSVFADNTTFTDFRTIAPAIGLALATTTSLLLWVTLVHAARWVSIAFS